MDLHENIDGEDFDLPIPLPLSVDHAARGVRALFRPRAGASIFRGAQSHSPRRRYPHRRRRPRQTRTSAVAFLVIAAVVEWQKLVPDAVNMAVRPVLVNLNSQKSHHRLQPLLAHE